jgi:hypothetical protein
MPKSKKPGDQRLREPLPALDDDIDDSTSDQDDSSTNRQTDNPTPRGHETSVNRNVDTSTSEQGDSSTPPPESEPPVSERADNEDGDAQADEPSSRLRQQLGVLMDEVDLPADAPRMTEKTNAHISRTADDRLREAVRVLEMRYGKGFSKSLLVEYILRGALWDLREHAEDSQIVRVLDRIFDQRR